MNYIKIRKPDDFHIHLRQDDMLSFTLHHASNNFNRVLVMPNLSPPLIHTCDVKKYYNDIQNILNKNNWKLTCLMTLYLTEETSVNDIIEAKESKIIYSRKLFFFSLTRILGLISNPPFATCAVIKHSCNGVL